MTIPEFLDSSGRPFRSPQQLAFRTAKAPAVGHLLHSLGLAVSKRQADDGSDYLSVQCDGLRLKLVPAAETFDLGETTIHFAVDSLKEALRIAGERQAPIVQPTHESDRGRRAIIADPDGRRIVLLQRGTIPTFDDEETTASPAQLDDGTPLELLRAIGAVKRGLVFLLAGGALSVVVFVALTLNDPGSIDILLRAAVILAPAIILIGMVLCRSPKSPLIHYASSSAAITLHLTSIIVAFAAVGRSTDEQAMYQMLSQIISVSVPFLFYRQLVQIALVAKDQTLARLGDIVNLIYVVSAIMFLTSIGATRFSDTLAASAMVAFLFTSVAHIIGFVIFAVRFLAFQPIRPQKRVTISLETR